MMDTEDVNGKPAMRRVPVAARYPEDRVALLDAVRIRWGMSHMSDVISVALDRVLASEGFALDEAA